MLQKLFIILIWDRTLWLVPMSSLQYIGQLVHKTYHHFTITNSS